MSHSYMRKMYVTNDPLQQTNLHAVCKITNATMNHHVHVVDKIACWRLTENNELSYSDLIPRIGMGWRLLCTNV